MYIFFFFVAGTPWSRAANSFLFDGLSTKAEKIKTFFHFTCNHRSSFPLQTKSFFHWLLHVVLSYWWARTRQQRIMTTSGLSLACQTCIRASQSHVTETPSPTTESISRWSVIRSITCVWDSLIGYVTYSPRVVNALHERDWVYSPHHRPRWPTRYAISWCWWPLARVTVRRGALRVYLQPAAKLCCSTLQLFIPYVTCKKFWNSCKTF